MKRTYLKRIYLIVAIVSLSLLTAGFINYKKPVYMNIFPTTVNGMGEIVPSELFATWITDTTNVGGLPPQNVFVLPADGPNFVGDSGPTTAHPQGVPNNLNFHRWASQMFLWILSPVPANGSYGTASGLVLTSKEFYNYDEANQTYVSHTPNPAIGVTPEILKGGKNTINVGSSMTFSVKGTNNGGKNLPLLIEKETNQVFDVDKTPADDKGNPLIYDENRNRVAVSNIKITDNKPVFYDLNGAEIKKPSLIFSEGLDEKTTVQQFVFNSTSFSLSSLDTIPVIIVPSLGQASLSANTKNILMARNGSFVYYNIMVNDIYAVFSTMVTNGALSNMTKFPTTQAELDVIKAYASDHGIPLVDTNNRVLAMELKTSWVETIQFTGVNYNNYVTIHTNIPNYSPSTNGNVTTWSINQAHPTRPATLALVGMHVVGSVKGHPEMIWSTFEHANNTPNIDFKYDDGTSITTTQPTDVNSNNWLFCKPTATASSEFNVPYINQNNDFPYSFIATPGHSISSSNTRRHKPFGWSGPVNPASDALLLPEIPFEGVSNARLLALNYDVNTNLADGDVRKMYFQVGATWNSKTGRFSNSGNQHVGTISLSNSTMETYTQGSATTAPDGLNCFSCHESKTSDGAIRDMPKLTNLSHVFGYAIVPN